MVLSDEKTSEVQKGVNTLGDTSMKRVEGEGWKAYKVNEGTIRVDIETKE